MLLKTVSDKQSQKYLENILQKPDAFRNVQRTNPDDGSVNVRFEPDSPPRTDSSPGNRHMNIYGTLLGHTHAAHQGCRVAVLFVVVYARCLSFTDS